MTFIINPYVFIFDYDEKNVILFNSDGGAIVLFPKEKTSCGNLLIDNLTEDEIQHLKNERVLIDSKENTFERLYNEFLNYKTETKVIKISIELTTDCNLNCTYCYQQGWKHRKCISDETIEKVFIYIKKCVETNKYSNVVVNLIGGEPLLYQEKVELIVRNLKNISCEFGINVQIGIDTNGYYLNSDFLKIMEDIKCSISVTLSLPNDHDKNRLLKNGKGTFEVILNNLKSNQKFFEYPNHELYIRYNVNADNINDFPLFLDMIIENDIKLTAIHPMYTYEHNNTEFSNGLSFEKYQIWNSSIAIDEMIKRKMRITEYIQIVPKKCKACSPHSCKVFADGRIGLCDAMYHSNEFPTIDEAIQNIEIVNNYFAEIKNYNPYEDEECRKCKKIIMCSGKIFCNDSCEYSNIEVETFLKTLIKHIKNGNLYLFEMYG